jgi:hypothetical protein
MNACLVNYNFDPKDWWLKYGMEARVYDRSDDGIERSFAAKVVMSENRGNVDYDKLMFLVEFYDELPEVFLWGKTNLFKYITESEFAEKLEKCEGFTPLIRQDHLTYRDQYGLVNYYDSSGMYYEKNNSWYLNVHPAHNIYSWHDWAQMFRLPEPAFIPFAPGGNYILTRETVHKHSRDLYREMAETMPYTTLPGEAQLAERSYYLLWS